MQSIDRSIRESRLHFSSPKRDEALSELITQETTRQEKTINLIASENYVSPAVLAATGSVLTNKYAEGNAFARYYQGCEFVDKVEDLAIERCKKLFGCAYANVQAHSGSNANMAAYAAVLQPGDTLMGMSLADGGHLTHGHSVNFSGRIYKTVQYGVNPETELLDYDAIEAMALEHKPKMIVVGASAYSRIIDYERMGQISKKVGAFLLADIAHIAGLIAAGLHPNPFPHADIATSTVHKTLRGARGGIILTNNPELAKKIDKEIMPGTQGGPLMHSIAGKAVTFFEALQPEFKTYQQQTIKNARLFSDLLIQKGYRIVSGGTDNHLFIVDLTAQNISGSKAAKALELAGIVVSKSCIPNDSKKPWIGSGVRLGTPAITTRGMQEQEVAEIAQYFDEVIMHHEDEAKLAEIKAKVEFLCAQFPVYK